MIDFRNCCLTGTCIMYIDLEGADCRNTDFRFSVLQEIDFWSANLQNAQFQDCILNGADFRRTDLLGAIFTGATRGPDDAIPGWNVVNGLMVAA